MRQLELSDDEARELDSALTAHLHVLRAELSRADSREFKQELRERLDLLEEVAARLALAGAATEQELPA
jgi:hypothetical protein